MFIFESLPFVTSFVDSIDQTIKHYHPGCRLTRIQKSWLAFCIMSIFITRTVCWAKFERACLGTYSMAAISWMFRKSKIPWNILLIVSTIVILNRFGITHGCLAIDETDKNGLNPSNVFLKLIKLKTRQVADT